MHFAGFCFPWKQLSLLGSHPCWLVRYSPRWDRGASDKKKEWTTTQNNLVHSNTEETWIGFPVLIRNYSFKCFISSRRVWERLLLKCPLALGATWSMRRSKLEPEAWAGNSGAVYSCSLCAQTFQPEKVLHLPFNLSKNIAAKCFSWMIDS